MVLEGGHLVVVGEVERLDQAVAGHVRTDGSHPPKVDLFEPSIELVDRWD